MNPLRTTMLTLALAAATAAFAQNKTSPGVSNAPGASAPMVTPTGVAPPRPTPGNTPNLTAMNPQEREQYRQDLARAKSGDECRAVVARQRDQAAKRAHERGEPAPNNVGADPCAGR